jgi:hypothetical protein
MPGKVLPINYVAEQQLDLKDGQASESGMALGQAFFTDMNRRSGAHKLLDSPMFLFVVVGLVLLDILHTDLLVKRIVLAFFVLECSTRMWAMGPVQYMTDIICYLDLFVTCISLFGFATQNNTAGMAIIGRFVRVLKLLRLLKGVRFVRKVRLQFIDVSGNLSRASLSGTFFTLFSNKAFETLSGDGLLSFAELRIALRSNQLMVPNHLLASVFNDVYTLQNQRALLFDNDIYRPFTELDDRTIPLTALEAYFRDIRPSTKQERRWRIASRVFTSLNFWSIFGYFVANVIGIAGQPIIGLYDFEKYWYLHAVTCFLWVVGGIGYIQLHYANLAHKFDQFEMVQITLTQHFKKVLAAAGAKNTPAALAVIDTPAALLSPPTSSADVTPTSQCTSRRRSVLLESADDALSIDDVRTLLSKKNVHVSDAALLHWFKKVGTSGDNLISRREIRVYISTWKPTSRNGKMRAVVESFFNITGYCLLLFLVAAFILLGNALLWRNNLDATTKYDLMICATYFWFCGILGFIRIGIQSVSNDFEELEGARRSLAVVLADSQASSQLFKAEDWNSVSAWLERVLSKECDELELQEWIECIQASPYLDNLNYFIAILKHNQPMLSQMTGIPQVVLYRLLEALDWDNEKPWIMKEASIHDLKNMLITYNILISEHNVRRIYREIDTNNSNSVSVAEFDAFRNARRKTASEKRWHVITTRLADPGFYLQLASLTGCIFRLGPGHYWPYAGTSVLSTVDSYQISVFLYWIGTFESVRQAVRTVIADVDMKEQAKLDFRRSVESASDALDRRAVAERLASLKAAAKKKAAASVLTAPAPNPNSRAIPSHGSPSTSACHLPTPGSNSRGSLGYVAGGASLLPPRPPP